MEMVSLRMPARLLAQLDELARRRRVSRSRLLRALAEDAVDVADEPPECTPELLAEISAAQDEELARLRQLSRG